MWMLSRDVVKLFAAAVCGIDLWAGMPGWWAMAEGCTIATVAVGIGFVNRRAALYHPPPAEAAHAR